LRVEESALVIQVARLFLIKHLHRSLRALHQQQFEVILEPILFLFLRFEVGRRELLVILGSLGEGLLVPIPRILHYRLDHTVPEDSHLRHVGMLLCFRNELAFLPSLLRKESGVVVVACVDLGESLSLDAIIVLTVEPLISEGLILLLVDFHLALLLDHNQVVLSVILGSAPLPIEVTYH